MTNFEMIKYHGLVYPDFIPLRTEEIAAHFDIQQYRSSLSASLHTEYSYGKRKLDSPLLKSFPAICEANKNGVPQLWKNELWAEEFAEFMIALVGNKSAPSVIEIHPPFSDYTDLTGFIASYSVFEQRMLAAFPSVQILIENRYGSVYHGGRFILSKNADVFALAELVSKNALALKVAYDIPQIYTAHNANTEENYTSLLKEIKPCLEFVGGVHLWGKCLSESGRRVAHCGDLSSYFGNEDTKVAFLQTFKACFNDDATRKLVLEVNSGNADLQSIINDLCSVGVNFG